jgi:hypothetical protein
MQPFSALLAYGRALLAITPIRKNVYGNQEGNTNHQVGDSKEREEHGGIMPPHCRCSILSKYPAPENQEWGG